MEAPFHNELPERIAMASTSHDPTDIDVESAVKERYSAASRVAEPALCCSVQYDPKYLAVLPAELIERDYGCGDPSRYVRPGETVLDLGSGGGKACYIASQVVGPNGRVIGVDMNDDMLDLARKFREDIGRRIGWSNVEFRKGRIQDLALDIEEFNRYLEGNPVGSTASWLEAERQAAALRQQSPLIATSSIDVVISNCVLNLVHPGDRQQLFSEVFRVLKPGGRAVISDIVSSAQVPAHLRNDPELWSGCISGAYEEFAFLEAFESAGFIGLQIIERQPAPWMVVESIEFRSLTIQAFKLKPPLQNVSKGEVIYRGPWRRVIDDEGHEFIRGKRTSVSSHVYTQMIQEPFSSQMISAEPASERAESKGILEIASDQSCCRAGTKCSTG